MLYKNKFILQRLRILLTYLRDPSLVFLFLFISESNIANYACDTALSECENNLNEIETKLESYYRKINGKNSFQLNIDRSLQSNEKKVEPLEIRVSYNFSFKTHLSTICSVVNQKIHALRRFQNIYLSR